MENYRNDFLKLGARMRKLRIQKGYKSMHEFSDQIDIHRVRYAEYEAGIGNIKYKTLLQVTRGLGISIKDFFSEGFE